MKHPIFLFVTFLAMFASAVNAQDVIPGTRYSVDGIVVSYVVDPITNRLVAGGPFTGVGITVGPFAITTKDTGRANVNLANLNGDVLAIIANPMGGYFVAGSRNIPGYPSRGFVVRIKADLTIDEKFAPNINAPVRTLAFFAGGLCLGGDFSEVEGQQRPGLAMLAMDGSLRSWSPKIERDLNEGRPRVLALAASDYQLIVCGGFDTFDNKPRKGFARIGLGLELSTTTISLDDQYDCTSAVIGSDKSLYVGVRTRRDGSIFGGWIVKVVASSGKIIWQREVENSPSSMSLFRNTLYANARRTYGDPLDRRVKYASAFNLQDGFELDWDPQSNGLIAAIVASPNGVYLAGQFSRLGTEMRTNAGAVTRIQALPIDWNPAPTGFVQCLLESSESMLLGGYFNGINSKRRNFIVEINLTTQEITEFDPGLNGSVMKLVLYDGVVYCFSGSNRWAGQVSPGASAFSILNHELTGFYPWRTLGTIYDAVVDDNDVFAVGDLVNYPFKSPSGQQLIRYNIVAYNRFTGEILPFNPIVDGIITSVKIEGRYLRIKGQFHSINGVPREGDALIDPTTGAPM